METEDFLILGVRGRRLRRRHISDVRFVRVFFLLLQMTRRWKRVKQLAKCGVWQDQCWMVKGAVWVQVRGPDAPQVFAAFGRAETWHQCLLLPHFHPDRTIRLLITCNGRQNLRNLPEMSFLLFEDLAMNIHAPSSPRWSC